jgi:hypothetical protein
VGRRSFTVSEVKRYSIDLGSNLTRIECVYSSATAKSVPLAAGIILRIPAIRRGLRRIRLLTGCRRILTPNSAGWVRCGVRPGRQTTVVKADGHLLLTLNQAVGNRWCICPSCWDKNEEFNSFDKWTAYLDAFAQGLKNPVKVIFN